MFYIIKYTFWMSILAAERYTYIMSKLKEEFKFRSDYFYDKQIYFLPFSMEISFLLKPQFELVTETPI